MLASYKLYVRAVQDHQAEFTGVLSDGEFLRRYKLMMPEQRNHLDQVLRVGYRAGLDVAMKHGKNLLASLMLEKQIPESSRQKALEQLTFSQKLFQSDNGVGQEESRSHPSQ